MKVNLFMKSTIKCKRAQMGIDGMMNTYAIKENINQFIKKNNTTKTKFVR